MRQLILVCFFCLPACSELETRATSDSGTSDASHDAKIERDGNGDGDGDGGGDGDGDGGGDADGDGDGDAGLDGSSDGDGGDVTTGVLDALARVVCQHEINCCDDNELNFKFGPGIASVDECTQLFDDLVKSGQSPSFFRDDAHVINRIIAMVQAINDESVNVALDADGIDECLEVLDWRECPEHVEPNPVAECVNPGPFDVGKCAIMNLVVGLQEQGKPCGDSHSVPECADGLFCLRESSSQSGICTQLPSAGDLCRDDSDCDPSYGEHYYGEQLMNLFCNKAIAECQALGDVGDPCEFIDSTFSIYNSDIDPWGGNRAATSVDCLPHLACDPITDTCINRCDAGWLCKRGGEISVPCPNGDLVCNVTAIPGLFDSYGYGTCTQPIEDGEEATYADECESGEFEPDALDESVFHCVAPKDEPGTACESEMAGAEDPLCSIGWCNENEECAAPCNCEGDDCDDYSTDEYGNQALECDDGFYCDWGNYRGNGVYACEPKIGNGMRCDIFDGVLHTSCTSGFCNTLATPTPNECRPKQTDATDAACESMLDEECPAAQYCNSMNTCRPYVLLGGSCELAAPPVKCHPELVCVSRVGTDLCQERAALGEACNVSNVDEPACAVGLTCVDVDGTAGTESACYGANGPFANGVDCTLWGPGGNGNAYCASAWCRPSSPVAPMSWECAPKIPEGDPCDGDDSSHNLCEDGMFCNYPSTENKEGECAPQRRSGQSCQPLFNGMDCLNYGAGGDCVLANDQFVCNEYAQLQESLFCDGR